MVGHSSRFAHHAGQFIPLILAGFFALSIGSTSVIAAEKEKWRFGVVEAKGDAGLLFMPAKFGGKYDLDIEMVEFASSTTPVKALISGDIDAFTVSPGVALVAMSRGADMKFIGCNWPGATYTLYGAADVKSLQDLKGKSIAVSGPGSMPDLFAREALASSGLVSAQVTFANGGGGSDRYRALAAGVVQATATLSEFEPDAEKRGFNILARASEITPKFARNCIVTTGKTIASRADGLKRFLAANMEAISFALTHRDETIALTREIAKLPADNTGPEFVYDEAVRTKALDPSLAMPVEKLQWIEDMLVRHEVVDSTTEVTAFIDDKPRQAALTLAKPQ